MKGKVNKMVDWLSELKVGDRVIVSSNRNYDYLKKVKRLTKTVIVLDNNMRYNRSTGGGKGEDAWSMTSLMEANPTNITILKEVIEKRKLIRDLQTTAFTKLSNRAMKAMLKIAQEDWEEDHDTN